MLANRIPRVKFKLKIDVTIPLFPAPPISDTKIEARGQDKPLDHPTRKGPGYMRSKEENDEINIMTQPTRAATPDIRIPFLKKSSKYQLKNNHDNATLPQHV